HPEAEAQVLERGLAQLAQALAQRSRDAQRQARLWIAPRGDDPVVLELQHAAVLARLDGVGHAQRLEPRPIGRRREQLAGLVERERHFALAPARAREDAREQLLRVHLRVDRPDVGAAALDGIAEAVAEAPQEVFLALHDRLADVAHRERRALARGGAGLFPDLLAELLAQPFAERIQARLTLLRLRLRALLRLLGPLLGLLRELLLAFLSACLVTLPARLLLALTLGFARDLAAHRGRGIGHVPVLEDPARRLGRRGGRASRWGRGGFRGDHDRL